MAKCLVSGGAGFIGSNIVEALGVKGHEVIVLDSFFLGHEGNLAKMKNSIHIARGDIRDYELLMRLTRGVDYIYHEAAASSSMMFEKDLRGAYSINVDGMINILNAARDNGVKRVMYASSSTVYGNSSIPFKEDSKPEPGNFYASSKLAGEYLATIFSNRYGLETVGFRYMSVYGPNEITKGPYANVLTQFLLAMRRDESPTIYGDGTQARDFTCVKDVVHANILAMEHEGKLLGEIFNVGTGRMTTFNESVDIVNSLLGKQVKPRYVKEVPIKGYQKYQLAEISKISQRLGYKPEYDLRKGLELTLASLKER